MAVRGPAAGLLDHDAALKTQPRILRRGTVRVMADEEVAYLPPVWRHKDDLEAAWQAFMAGILADATPAPSRSDTPARPARSTSGASPNCKSCASHAANRLR